MNEIYIPGTGARSSNYDVRTVKHDLAVPVPFISGGYIYNENDIDNQHKVGICTSISLTQNAGKYFGKKFSPDFQYLLQKKFIDGAWYEGSSIFSALKVGKTYGFLPIDEFTYVTEADRDLTYPQYIAKLQAIPDSEIQRLIKLCTNKLTGYASVDVSSAQSIAKAIIDSKTGILCRYTAGESWYTAKDGRISWASSDIDPLRQPTKDFSGHAIGAISFDYSINLTQTLANTWGTAWNDLNKGQAHVDWHNYQMTEAWIPYYDYTPTIPPFTHSFQVDMQIGQSSDEVLALQQALSTLGFFKVNPTGFYGDVTRQAVLDFQIAKVQLSWYERYVLRGNKVGLKTRTALNLIFNK